ncbi:DUF1576 domain-containing protein [Ruminococcaceae bacterium OttesenSCG-928-D13]|nr:DUF1576 domain-containing protein [Ruminococcaceae bacterium OttesenSCG-928-D13]
MQERRPAHAHRHWRQRLNAYDLILISLGLFVVAALIADPPIAILYGLWNIFTHTGHLLTDYVAVGGVGAALINAVITGLCGVGLMHRSDAKPNGAIIMALWLTIGFSFFGKNIFSMAPILYGVWLYSRYQREPFRNYALVALLSSTMCPIVSEFNYSGLFDPLFAFVGSGLLGILVGFFIPIISAATNRVHGGYDLYNIGFAGGIIAMFIVAVRNSLGLPVAPTLEVSDGNNLFFAILLYVLFAMWCGFSLFDERRETILPDQKRIAGHSGRLVTDYFLLYKESAFLNMGIMGIIGTTITLVLGAPLNGVSIAGIITMMGFGVFGKHPRNCLPVMAGAVLFACVNQTPLTTPSNIAAILFCTGLAPISGQYGWAWGMLAGVLHTAIVAHVGQVTGGLNLYSNGFAAGFVALVLVPVILAFRRGKEET